MTANLFNTGPLQFANAVAAWILIKDEVRYRMQLRDQKPGIFCSDHFVFLGGAVEAGEQAIRALQREMQEQLSLSLYQPVFITALAFGSEKLGHERPWRRFYEVIISTEDLPSLRLRKGSRMAVAIEDLLLERKTAAYDPYAIWLHTAY